MEKIKNIYKFADLNVSVATLYYQTHDLCLDYLETSQIPDFFVEINKSDIEYEYRASAKDGDKLLPSGDLVKDSYLETLAVLRKISEKMPEYDAFLYHGSCIAVDGEGYLFSAPSGVGKSTHARNWRKLLGERALMVNDDKPFIRIKDKEAFAYGSPWNGKHRLGNNTSVPLRSLCIIERSEKNSICRISKEEAYPMILGQTYFPADGRSMEKTLCLIDRFIRNVDIWRLRCNKSIESAEIAYDAMKG